jgi:D-apionolactonase
MSSTALSFEPLLIGPLALRLDSNGAFVREISVGGEELFRGLGFVVRDANWGTLALAAKAVVSREDGRIVVRSGGVVDDGDGDLIWSTTWTIADNYVEADARASSKSGFDTNRTGFVALHALPATRGRPVRVRHPDGSVDETQFPDLVSPHQPFFDIAGLDYATAAGNRLRLVFEGEVFEIEDQRNWTDASYKTYCRPLRLPFPYRIEPSTIIEQKVRLEILAAAPSRPVASNAPPLVEKTATMPSLGTSLPPGLALPGQAEALKALQLGFTAIEIDPSDADWLTGAAARIAVAPGPLRIDVRGGGADEARKCVNALAPLLASKTIVGLSLWDADAATIAAARTTAPGVRVGGGTGAFFTELNRMKDWPPADYLAWTSNPTVHGFDDDTIGETTEPLGDIIRTARARSSSARFQVGPMTLGLRYNPNAATAEGRRRGAPFDPRQSGMIAAAWLVATIAGYLDPAVETLTFFEPIGPKGLVANDGVWSPAAYALARLSPFANHPVSVLRWPDHPRAAGLLIEAADQQVLCVAHPRDEDLRPSLPSGSWRHAETLTPTGFIQAPVYNLRVEPFGVSWLVGARSES